MAPASPAPTGFLLCIHRICQENNHQPRAHEAEEIAPIQLKPVCGSLPKLIPLNFRNQIWQIRRIGQIT